LPEEKTRRLQVKTSCRLAHRAFSDARLSFKRGCRWLARLLLSGDPPEFL
jgi:hypothetical protein